MSIQEGEGKKIQHQTNYCWICKYLHAILLSSIGKGKKIEIKFVGAIADWEKKCNFAGKCNKLTNYNPTN